jgi:hypothetical protein
MQLDLRISVTNLSRVSLTTKHPYIHTTSIHQSIHPLIHPSTDLFGGLLSFLHTTSHALKRRLFLPVLLATSRCR